MNIKRLGADGPRLKLKVMSDVDLWWLCLNHREECHQELWEEVEKLEKRRAPYPRTGVVGRESPSSPVPHRSRFDH